MTEASKNEKQEVIIYYTNYRGETAERRICPLKLIFDSNEWHREPQWLLEAIDVEKGAERTFSLSTIHHWRNA